MQFSLVMVSPEGGGYSGFQVMGMIEWGTNRGGGGWGNKKTPPPPPPQKGFQQNPKKSLDQKLTPKKSHAKFLSL